MEMVRSTDEQLPETIEAHYLNACLNMQTTSYKRIFSDFDTPQK
jgi:hypothetical protein